LSTMDYTLPMNTVAIASNNPVKIQAVLDGFKFIFPKEEWKTVSIEVPSGVSHQPMTDAETFSGAFNRAHNAQKGLPEADFWVGIEGGVEDLKGEMFAFAWVVVASSSMLGQARSGTFKIPPTVAKLVREGKELGTADDIIFGRENSKQKNGAIGLLTDDAIDRKALYQHAVVLALVPFKNPRLYPR
jgi:inosine/xanthosine triphosphatase